jgi:hypothetical protein
MNQQIWVIFDPKGDILWNTFASTHDLCVAKLIHPEAAENLWRDMITMGYRCKPCFLKD